MATGGYNRGTPLRTRVSITAAGSIQIFASATTTRWALFEAFIGWANASVDVTLQLMEGSTSIIRQQLNTTGGWARIEFGDAAMMASDQNSSLRLNTDGGGSVTGYFIGFRRGYDD
jgi:hypothetical protein